MYQLPNQSFLEALEHPVIQETLDALLLVLDTNGNIVSFNRACENASGYRKDEVLGRHYEMLIPEDQQKSVNTVFNQLKAGESPNRYLNEWQTRTGQRHYIQWSNSVLQDPNGKIEFIVACGIDVTAHRDTVLEMCANDKRFHDLVKISDGWLWAVDAAGIYTYVGPKISEILGYSPEQITGKPLFDLMSPAEAEKTRSFFEQAARTAAPVTGLIAVYLHADGHEIILESCGVPLISARGEFQGYRGMARDVTAHYKLEQELRESEARLRLSQEYAHIGSWEWSIDSGDLVWSDQIWPLFGYQDKSLAPTYDNFLQAVHPDDRDTVTNAIDRCLEQGARYDVEHRVVWPNGHVHWVREIGNVKRDDAGRPVRML
ncbi:MAG TPA: bifunctional diguanylate cyclase/phosphodiesterase, partial [Chromatiales bacterium]|nr:bifunctional diguanylate cyclase/phosphodiesterase [Chromatiales bacterium]